MSYVICMKVLHVSYKILYVLPTLVHTHAVDAQVSLHSDHCIVRCKFVHDDMII